MQQRLSLSELPFGYAGEMSTDRTGSDFIRTEANFGRIWARSGLHFFYWRIKTGLEWENFFCIYVIIVNISKILVVIRFYRCVKWECIFPWMAKALLRQFCNSNCIHLCAHIMLSSTTNGNIVEWLVSIWLLCKCSFILLSPFALAQLEEITPLMGMLFMYFLTCLGLGQCFSTWGLFACFLWVASTSDEYIRNYLYILPFVHETTFCSTQNSEITWQYCSQ